MSDQKVEKRERDNIESVTWWECPSVLWLFFLPFFFLPLLSEAWETKGALILLIVITMHFGSYTEHRRQLWRRAFFLPMAVTLGLLFIIYAQFRDYFYFAPLVGMAINALWIILSIYFLQVDQRKRYAEWHRSAVGALLLSLLFLALIVAERSFLGRSSSVVVIWLPAISLLLYVLVHLYTFNRRYLHFKDLATCPSGMALLQVALIQGDKVWLSDAPYTGCVGGGCGGHTPCQKNSGLGHPFTTCIPEGETPEDAIQRMWRDAGIKAQEAPRFLQKYHRATVDSEEQREVYFFAINLDPREQHLTVDLRGRFYSPEEVQALAREGSVTPTFMDEYTYLSHTLLLTNRLLSTTK